MMSTLKTTFSIDEQFSLISQLIAYQATDGLLEELSLYMPDFREKIIASIRPGIFMRKHDFSLKDILKWDEQSLAELDFSWFQSIAELKQVSDIEMIHGTLFSSKVQASGFAQSRVVVTLDWDDYSYDMAKVKTVTQFKHEHAQADLWDVRLMLAPPHIILDLDGYGDNVQEWQWSLIDSYEKFVHQVSQQLNTGLRAYIQVGGWANYIQDGDEDDFIAQINCEVGDAGSVYVGLDHQGKLESFVQMF
jgi:hypothetical protein